MGILTPETESGERPGPRDIWRTWLMTGARAHPIDGRRLQGRHRGLKQILAEGGDSDALRRPWRDFSRAMARQSVNEAMLRLTARERVVITMAYFAGFSNEEISDELGMTVRGVQRSLRRALDRLSDALDRGKRVALGLCLALAGGRLGRWLSDTATPAATQAVAVAGVVAAVAVAPVAVTSGPHHAPATWTPTTTARPASSAAAATAPSHPVPGAPAARSGSVVTAPSVNTPVVTPPVAVPQLPRIKLPKVTVPKAL